MKQSRIDLIGLNGATGEHYTEMYYLPPWNLKIEETTAQFGAPRFYWCFAYKGFRLCSEIQSASKEIAEATAIKYMEGLDD